MPADSVPAHSGPDATGVEAQGADAQAVAAPGAAAQVADAAGAARRVGDEPAPGTHWTVSGPADAPPIVFVHGAMMGRSVWSPQIERLSGRFRCVTVDLPGHGSRRGHRFELESAAAGVAEAIDRAAGGRCVLVGLSLGGYTAMTVAARYPGKVRGLVIAGSTREPEGLSRLGFLLYAYGLRLAPEPAVRAVALAWFRRRYGSTVANAITAGGHFAKGGSAAVKRLVGGRFREKLKAYGGPILVVNGSMDLVFRVGANSFLRDVPGATYRMIPRAGHLSNVDAPDAFTGLVEEFVATLPE
jgi:pimeloyl-ACP methyl ester carboxylesterase